MAVVIMKIVISALGKTINMSNSRRDKVQNKLINKEME